MIIRGASRELHIESGQLQRAPGFQSLGDIGPQRPHLETGAPVDKSGGGDCGQGILSRTQIQPCPAHVVETAFESEDIEPHPFMEEFDQANLGRECRAVAAREDAEDRHDARRPPIALRKS